MRMVNLWARLTELQAGLIFFNRSQRSSNHPANFCFISVMSQHSLTNNENYFFSILLYNVIRGSSPWPIETICYWATSIACSPYAQSVLAIIASKLSIVLCNVSIAPSEMITLLRVLLTA